MGFGLDLNAMKLEASKASEAEKIAIINYMHEVRAIWATAYDDDRPEQLRLRDVIDRAIVDPAISPQTFVAFCVWAFA